MIKGYKHSEGAKRIMSEIKKGKPLFNMRGENHPNKVRKIHEHA